MKSIRTIAKIVLCLGFLYSATSCAVFITRDNGRHVFVPGNNGKHNGWYKNPNNPHNPYSTNMENGKGKGKQKK